MNISLKARNEPGCSGRVIRSCSINVTRRWWVTKTSDIVDIILFIYMLSFELKSRNVSVLVFVFICIAIIYRLLSLPYLCLTPLSATFQLYHGDQCQWWKKPEYPERTTDHGQATGKLYHLRVECTLFVIYKPGREPTPYW